MSIIRYIIQMQFKVKAGRFVFDKQTKKVKVSKQKGLIHVLRNQEQQTHFKWANLETNTEDFDIIVFEGDAKFEPVADKNNTFVLRFEMDQERYFFWLQEKTDPATVVKQINKVINFVEEEPQNQMVDEGATKKQSDKAPQPQVKPQPSQPVQQPAQHGQPAFSADFISKIAQGLANASKKHHQKQITAITHLTEVLTPQSINTVLKELTEEQKTKLAQFMPQEHQQSKYLPSSLRSPQFMQALDALSDALNSENALPLFMELGLNQEFLHKNYGVQAFLLALIEKSKKKQ